MSWWESILLGLVQGLTEFLPISSSGHLVLVQYLLDVSGGDDVIFEVFVHFGTVLSILTVYRREVGKMIVSILSALKRPFDLAKQYREDDFLRTATQIVVTLIPTGIVYVLFRDFLESAFGDPQLVCGMLIVTGILLVLTVLRRDPQGEMTAPRAFVVGIAQAAAMIPGISRSGSTICTALYQNVNPEKAANFSFLMLLPVVVGATLLKSVDLIGMGMEAQWTPIVLGTVVAYAAGVAAIRILLRVIRRGRLQYFAVYCFLVGGVGLWLL
jgi:undecaprenyl-diphosphatase